MTANGLGPALANLVRVGGEGDFNTFLGGVTNFEYELGNEYTINVAKYRILNPPADGGSIDFELINIVDQSEGSTTETFEVFLRSNFQGELSSDFLTGNSEIGYKLLNRITIICNDICNLLETPLNENEALYGTFTRNDNNEYVLQEIDLRN